MTTQEQREFIRESEARKAEAYVPQVGDRIAVEMEIFAKHFMLSHGEWEIRINEDLSSSLILSTDDLQKHAKLLSRKSPRKITRAELEEMVGGEFILVEE